MSKKKRPRRRPELVEGKEKQPSDDAIRREALRKIAEIKRKQKERRKQENNQEK